MTKTTVHSKISKWAPLVEKPLQEKQYTVIVEPCQVDPLCPKTGDYMAALADAEYKNRKYSRQIALQEREIHTLRTSLSKSLNAMFAEIFKETELERLRKEMKELVDFKNRFQEYEPLLQNVEEEMKLKNEIQEEIRSMETEDLETGDIFEYIRSNLSISKEKYERILAER
jgi:hypothetical protein